MSIASLSEELSVIDSTHYTVKAFFPQAVTLTIVVKM
jgi:hypothetical protein